jgi:hypothetical protein
MKNERVSERRGFVLVAILMISFATGAFSQSTTGTVLGTVKDQSAAVLPGVEISVVNLSTNQSRTAITNERGDYSIPQLSIGFYSVTASLPGFKTEVRSRIEIQVDQRAKIDFQLEVGQVSDKVMVTAEAPLVQANDASVGTVVDNIQIQQLPLNSRDFEKLAYITPGVSPPQSGSSLSFRGGISIAGTNERGNNFTLDGTTNTTYNVFTYVYKPSVDEIQEFKVQPSAYDAEAGRGEGGQVTVTTKSGTNDFHGGFFEFLRNDAMDARNFFDVQKPPYKRNQFGGNFGGPIRKDKTFFFYNLEELKLRQHPTRTATVPTLAMRNGDFSGLPTINDPLTGQPFFGNAIPGNRLHPAGVRMMSLFPQPNLPGSVRNFVASPNSPDNSTQMSLRIDHTFSAKDTVFARYSRYWDLFLDAYNQQSGFSNLPGFGRVDLQHNHQTMLNWTHVFSPTLLNTFKAGFSRLRQNRTPQDPENYVSFLGIPGPVVRDPSISGVPAIRPNGIEPIGNPSNLPQARVDQGYQFIDTLSWNKGSHGMKFGVDIGRMQIFRDNFGDDRGTYTFAGQYSGSGVADMLLGLPSQVGRAIGDSHNWWFQSQYMFFFQDDWKLTPRLTVNLGMRYENIFPWYDKFNRASNFNPATGVVELAGSPTPQREYLRVETLDPTVAAASAQLKFVDLGTKYFYNKDNNNFMPRLGFAWDARGTGKLLVRGGTGIFFTTLQTTSSNGNNFPFRLSQTFTNLPLSNGVLPPNAFTLTAPFAGTASATITLTARNHNFPVGYVQKYSMGVQWEFWNNYVLDLNYTGSYSRHLDWSRNINQPPPGPGNVNLRRPFPSFGSISYDDPGGSANYNALEARVERRLSQGLLFASAYTLSKVIDDTHYGGNGDGTQQDQNNRHAERGLASFDSRQRWVVSLVYDLPMGHGHDFLGSSPRVVDAVLGGWQLSGIQTLQSGRPFTPVLTIANSNTGSSSTDRPDRIGNGNLSSSRDVDHWFDTSAFVSPPPFTFGNSGHNILFGPGINNLDISFGKNFRVGEARQLQFRGEFFNFFNRVNFDLPNANFGTPDFGKIFLTAGLSRQVQLGLKFKF